MYHKHIQIIIINKTSINHNYYFTLKIYKNVINYIIYDTYSDIRKNNLKKYEIQLNYLF